MHLKIEEHCEAFSSDESGLIRFVHDVLGARYGERRDSISNCRDQISLKFPGDRRDGLGNNLPSTGKNFQIHCK